MRVINSLIGVPFGFLCLIAMVAMLYWNEGRAVRAATALQEGERAVVDTSAAPVDPGMSGKLVHVTGPLKTERPVNDNRFPVGGADVVRLRRVVEMYQWSETKHTRNSDRDGDRETTYSYSKTWSDRPINSSSFHDSNGHSNPSMPIRGATFDSTSAKLGDYAVDRSVLDQMDNFSAFDLGNTQAPSGYRVQGQTYYHGQDSGNPQIGDLRVNFEAVTAQTMSVVAAQQSGALTAYHARNGYEIALASPGTVAADTMLKQQEASERTLTWILRGVGFVVMAIGFMLIMGPLSAIASFIPLLGGIVEAGAFIVSLALAIPTTLVVIALAWVAHRPVLGIGLLVVAAAVFVGLGYRHRHRTALAVPAK